MKTPARLLRLVRALALSVLPSALLLGALAQPSAAANSWSGTCSYDNFTNFWPPQKAVPQPSGYYSRGSGHCKGTLNGAPFDGTGTIDAWANMHQQMSCEIGYGPNGGPAYLTFVTGAGRAPGSSTATASQQSTSKPVRRSRKRSRHRVRHRGKRAHRAASTRRAAVRAASSDTPRDPSQPVPRPPIPTTPEPTVEVWLDIVTAAPNLISGDMQGAFRGYAVGAGAWTSGDPTQCLRDGVPAAPSKMTWTTVTELRG